MKIKTEFGDGNIEMENIESTDSGFTESQLEKFIELLKLLAEPLDEG